MKSIKCRLFASHTLILILLYGIVCRWNKDKSSNNNTYNEDNENDNILNHDHSHRSNCLAPSTPSSQTILTNKLTRAVDGTAISQDIPGADSRAAYLDGGGGGPARH